MKEKDDVNKKINVNLINRLQEPFNYTEFNGAIIRSGEDTTIIDNSDNQGWFHFIRDTLTPALEGWNTLLHNIQYDDNNSSLRTLCHLNTLQHKVDEAVSVAKTSWSCRLAEEIHNMHFNPKADWASIRRLTEGK